ncbi:unnamed protein product [Effrenium voratum]|uniref:DUF1275 domain-containing protein n=1 Tax=Effrenium voratum TaxID=2562239 RepID=A0AA36NEU0_9DINO|nr:unnamed protein product [Effrenium voratum]CAJ1404452.1 unnamed protein product [Effrenium voratum]CAJ1445136.1 unnamed protein product [Effrenium voratum]
MVSSEAWRFQKHAWIATLFAIISGYADVVSLARYQAFASILTGNVIWLARVTVHPASNDKHSGWFYAALCGSFALGAFLHRICELYWPNRGGSLAVLPFAMLMLMMETVYLIVDSDRVFDEPYLRWSVVLVSPMFGVISAACSTGRMGTHTTMVTGHVLTISGLLGNLVFLRQLREPEIQKLIMSTMVIAGTIGGACLGGWMVMTVSLHVLLFPVPIITYVLLWLHDHLCRPRSLIKKVQKRMRENARDLESMSVESVSDSLEDDEISSVEEDSEVQC